jgi:hypothetical protein
MSATSVSMSGIGSATGRRPARWRRNPRLHRVRSRERREVRPSRWLLLPCARPARTAAEPGPHRRILERSSVRRPRWKACTVTATRKRNTDVETKPHAVRSCSPYAAESLPLPQEFSRPRQGACPDGTEAGRISGFVANPRLPDRERARGGVSSARTRFRIASVSRPRQQCDAPCESGLRTARDADSGRHVHFRRCAAPAPAGAHRIGMDALEPEHRNRRTQQ